MIIKNRQEISTTELRREALDIVEAGISRVLAPTLLKSAVSYDPSARIFSVDEKVYDTSRGRIFVIGGGKAVGLMSQALEEIVGSQSITAGIVNCTSKAYATTKIQILEASHPTPDERGKAGVEEMLSLKDRYSICKNDLVMCLISGGGSALMPYPVKGVSLEDKQKTTRLLLGSGANIREINIVRKHLSGIKGGRLGHHFSPARVVSLIISDVVGNDLESIASGPTVPDSSTFQDAYALLEGYDLLSKAPASVIQFLKRGTDGKEEETPKNLDNCDNHIIGDNMLALKAMAEAARQRRLTPYIVTAEQTGDPGRAAWLRAEEIMHGRYSRYDVVLIGGETTPKLPETPGKGGRNQHYVAASMLGMKGYARKWVLASAGTDGSDYLSDVAGAIVDDTSLSNAIDKGLNVQSYLDRYDTNTLLGKLGGSLIITGNTGTNVCDVIIYILK